MLRSKQLATDAPAAAPRAAPISHCFEVAQAAPSVDCITRMVVIGAQDASSIRQNRATIKDAVAARALQAACLSQLRVAADKDRLRVLST